MFFGLLNMMNNINENKVELKMLDLDDKYVVVGKILGVQRNNINLNYENDYLTITVRVNKVNSRRGYGSFYMVQTVNDIRKNFYVPNVDSKSITGKFENGNLIISLPKNILSIKNKVIVEVEEYHEQEKLE
ncbi:Hsp20 family protein [Clostridium fungisolvens]|uniref:18 kDa heat shock protein n=1 Tax=Clostridium fungisolvens TaxID=1604897 RepID=A0A6V8SCU0_9CLOT|nr:Hsp20 family protein [Clostridium fungisolvens]GFP75064.1 18 kDa heat shock protein [Clostridium fungisolvens]